MPPRKRTTAAARSGYTIPGLSRNEGAKVAAILQERLNALTDLHLTLKHVHWNVIGPNFIAVHEMIDPQVDAVRAMTDAVAERIATLGGSPIGTPGAIVKARTWDDYAIGRANAIEHLGALDVVYTGVIEDQRKAIDATESLDPVTQDLLIAHSGELELFHWFVRAHLENSSGELSTGSATTVKGGAQKAGSRSRTR